MRNIVFENIILFLCRICYDVELFVFFLVFFFFAFFHPFIPCWAILGWSMDICDLHALQQKLWTSNIILVED